LIHGVAFFFFGVSILAAWAIVAGLAATIVAIIACLAWEFRQSTFVPTVEPVEPTTSAQDVSLLMLSRSAHHPAPNRQRRTRTRLIGHHPVTDRIVSLHRPPHLDRRMRTPISQPEFSMIPLVELPRQTSKVMPSAN